MLDGLHVDWIGGYCPVQAEGTIAGRPWYFRARGQQWSFEVKRPAGEGAFVASGARGDNRFAAGYMPHAVAMGFIERSARAFLSSLG